MIIEYRAILTRQDIEDMKGGKEYTITLPSGDLKLTLEQKGMRGGIGLAKLSTAERIRKVFELIENSNKPISLNFMVETFNGIIAHYNIPPILKRGLDSGKLKREAIFDEALHKKTYHYSIPVAKKKPLEIVSEMKIAGKHK